MDYESVLRQYFGYPSFRGIQKDIVESIGSGKDTLGLMPTGGGKSITFQVPALTKDGVCIVVTPLISLMRDQVEHLKARNILAAYINSSLSRQEILQTLDNAIYGGVKFLYISPERIGTKIFQDKLYYLKVSFIVVDEAHCISQWGYDFRPAYLNIAKIRELKPDAPILALTATATPDVVDDIQDKLLFKRHNVFRMSFRRENLVYVVRNTDDKLYQIVHILKAVPGSAIIYTRDRQNTKDVACYLTDNGFSASYYHAGLDFAVKDQRQQDWHDDKTRVMVATNAFGMGIDKPDVRLVIHYDAPESIEAYFQEAGRAGRDGKRSYAVLLSGKKDVNTLRVRITNDFPRKDYVRKVYDHLAYFFQLAVASGEGAVYEFDVLRFCQTFKHHPVHLYPALTILQRAGYIEYDDEPNNRPRVRFLLGRDDLYRLNQMSPNEELVIETMLRYYCNLFVDFVFVDLNLIADKTGLPVDVVHSVLKSLSHYHILNYIPARRIPTIYYPKDRIESGRLHIDHSIYEDLKTRAESRTEAMVEYIQSEDKCHSQLLLRYFGEESPACGRCDACLKDKKSPDDSALKAREAIMSLFQSSEKVFLADIKKIELPYDSLMNVLSQMKDNGEITMNGSILELS